MSELAAAARSRRTCIRMRKVSTSFPGAPVLSIDARSYLVGAGDFGALKSARARWRNAGAEPCAGCRWPTAAEGEQARWRYVPIAADGDRSGRTRSRSIRRVMICSAFDVGQIPQRDEGRITGGGLQGVFQRAEIRRRRRDSCGRRCSGRRAGKDVETFLIRMQVRRERAARRQLAHVQTGVKQSRRCR